MDKQKYQEMIENLAQVAEADQKQAIHQAAVRLVGEEDEARLEAREAQLTEEVKAFNAMHVDAIAADYAQQRLKTTTTIDEQGFAGQATQVQAKIGSVGDASFFGHATLNQDKTGSLGSVNVGVNAVGKPQRVGDWHVLPVGRLEASIPLHGGDFGAQNVTGVAGAVIAPHDTKLNITAAVVSDGKLTDPAWYTRLSGTAYEGAVTVTPYAETVIGMKSGNVGAGAGVRVDKDLGNGYDVYGQAAVNAGGITSGDMSLSGQFTVGMMFGGETKKETPLETSMAALVPAKPLEAPPALSDSKFVNQPPHDSQRQHAVINTSTKDKMQLANTEARMEYEVDNLMLVNQQSAALQKAYEFYKALDAHPLAQQQFMAHMSENLAKAEPDSYPNAKLAQQSLQASFEQWGHVPQQQPSTDMSHG